MCGGESPESSNQRRIVCARANNVKEHTSVGGKEGSYQTKKKLGEKGQRTGK